MVQSMENLRTLTFVGHGGSGKTALVDAFAFLSKVSSRLGNPDDGTSISNTEPEEKDRHHTLSSHLFHFPWKGKNIQVIDNPGHSDFMADTLASFRAADAALFVVDAPTGVTFNTRQLWKRAKRVGLGRIMVLTRCDADNIDLDALIQDLQENFGDQVLPLTLPNETGAGFSSVTSVLRGEGAADLRASLDEHVAEADDALMEKYFEEGEISDEDLKKYLPIAIAKGTVVPLFVASGTSTIGVEELLDFIAEDGPNPNQVPHRRVAKTKDSEEYDCEVLADPQGELLALVFKIVSDPFVGKMSYLRIFRGTLKADSTITICDTGKAVKLNGLLKIQGKDSEPVDSAGPGEIIALAKIEDLELGNSVADEGHCYFFRPLDFPSPMVAVAVEPKSRSDEQKIGPSLEKLADEDPTFKVSRDPETGETLVEGLSQLHLDVMFHKLKRRFKVEVETHRPKVPYRETIQTSAEGHHRHKKQSGGRGQFAEVYIRVKPLDRGEGYSFQDKIFGGSIPRQFIPEVDKGIQSTLAKGILAGYKVVDCEVELYDGKFHDVDSDALSFQLAGGRAFMDGFEKAKPILLEPMMNVEIHVPSRFTGDITSNLSNQRARMTGMDAEGDDQIIHCTMPLKEARGYQAQLRSITAGEGSFSMTFSHFDPVPSNLAQEIISQSQAEKSKS